VRDTLLGVLCCRYEGDRVVFEKVRQQLGTIERPISLEEMASAFRSACRMCSTESFGRGGLNDLHKGIVRDANDTP